jgi:hypothetical protein
MKKILSFSLYGDKSIYTQGAIENVKLISETYYDWEARFYVDNLVPQKIIDELKDYNANIIFCGENISHNGMFWRFKPFYEDDVDVWLSRDCDSRISYRELACVDEWISSDKPFHIIRDSVNHGYEIMGGTFGVKNNEFAKKYSKPNIITGGNYNHDQIILANNLWPIIKHDHLCHDYWNHNSIKGTPTYQETDEVHFNIAYNCGLINYISHERKKRHINLYENTDNRDIPSHKNNKYGVFVGQILDENNNPIFTTDTRWEYELRGLK